MDRKEAIECIRDIMGQLTEGCREAIITAIPELVESEDERIRKALVKIVKSIGLKVFETEGVGKNNVLLYLERQKEQKPIKTEAYEVGKETTVCGQNYKCKKDYKAGNCWYIKGVIYHCSRDGYLNDQNGVSWSCTPEWFKEYIQSNTEWAEEEKTRFVSGQFLQCKLSFDGFKEGEHYWLEYVGDDMYVGRSDNILNQKFHITPRQLYTLFSQQLEEKQLPILEVFGFKVGDAVRLKDGDGRKHIIKSFEEVEGVHGPNFYQVEFEDDSARDGIYPSEEYPNGYYTQMEKFEKEQKPAEWTEEDKANLDNIIWLCENCEKGIENVWIPSQATQIKNLIKSIRPPFKPSEEQMEALHKAAKKAYHDYDARPLESLYSDLLKLKSL